MKKQKSNKTLTQTACLITCIHRGDIKGVENLLLRGVNTNCIYQGFSALHWAAQFGRLKIATTLINHGAKVNAKDVHGFTPLHIAVGENRLKLVRVLLKRGANYRSKAKGDSGGLPVHKAAAWGCLNVLKELIKAGSEIDVRDDSGYTPVRYAKKNGHLDIVAFIERLKKGNAKK
jgi:uncharacterized protein